MQFIVPAQPKLRSSLPGGNAWIHEVKFDGWRIQLHKQGRTVAIYTKNGHRCEHKLELIAAALTHLPVRSCVIDGELTACDEYGLPNFYALHFHKNAAYGPLICWKRSARAYLGGAQALPREARFESSRRLAAAGRFNTIATASGCCMPQSISALTI